MGQHDPPTHDPRYEGTIVERERVGNRESGLEKKEERACGWCLVRTVGEPSFGACLTVPTLSGTAHFATRLLESTPYLPKTAGLEEIIPLVSRRDVPGERRRSDHGVNLSPDAALA